MDYVDRIGLSGRRGYGDRLGGAAPRVLRARRRLVPFTAPGKDHTAHRLANLGLSHRGAVISLYGVGMFLGCLALLVAYRLSVGESYLLIAVLALAAIVAIIILEKAPFQRQEKSTVAEPQQTVS